MTGQPDGPGAMLAFAFYLALFITGVSFAAIGVQKVLDHFRAANRVIRDMPLPPDPATSIPRQETRV